MLLKEEKQKRKSSSQEKMFHSVNMDNEMVQSMNQKCTVINLQFKIDE